MAVSTAAAVVGGSLIGGAASAYGGKKAADAQKYAARTAADTQRYMYDQTREDQMPWMESGRGALAKLNELYGINQGGDASATQQLSDMAAANSDRFADFRDSPDYQFALEEGNRALMQNLAARGISAEDGAGMKAITRWAQGMASQRLGDYTNRLASMAGLGQTTAANLGNQGMGAAQYIGNAAMNAGDARASSYLNAGSAINQMAQLPGQYLMYRDLMG